MNRILSNAKRLVKAAPAGNGIFVRPDDVFLVSYPRSGNTWLRVLLGTLVTGEQIDFTNMELSIPDIYINSNRFLNKMPSPRILKSHESYDPRYPKVLYVVRDVRDVVVSYYEWFRKMKEDPIEDFDIFLSKFVEGQLDTFASWGSNVESWLGHQQAITKGFRLVKYEDLKATPVDVVQSICTFLGVTKTRQEIEDAVKWASFGNMSKMEKEQTHQSRVLKNSRRDIAFVRSGKTKQWDSLLTDKQLALIESSFGATLTKLGYSLQTASEPS